MECALVNQDGFYDRTDRFSYLLACETGLRILRDPALLSVGRAHLDRFYRTNPALLDAYTLWVALLQQGAQTVAERLTERTERGAYARQTAPSFGGIEPAIRAGLLQRAKLPIPAEA